MMTETIVNKYPLHYAVWQNDIDKVNEIISNEENKILLNSKDNHKRTPLLLAVTLGHIECAKLLISMNVDIINEDAYGFNVLHEAIASKNIGLMKLIMEKRDYQRYAHRIDGIPTLLRKLRDTPDFYLEMKWEFTSWVPLVCRMCPSDTYKIYKSGSSVRIDTTLLGFDQNNWQRGSRSFVFKPEEGGAVFLEIDHDLQQVHREYLRIISSRDAEELKFLLPTQEMIDARLNSPTTVTYVDTEKITFERSKSGLIGFRVDKNELINGHDCKVFTANNVEIITRTRTDHLTEEEKAKHKPHLSPLQSLLGMIEIEELPPETAAAAGEEAAAIRDTFNYYNITANDYFDEKFDLAKKDIGKLREISTKIQRFKANVWLCEEYPLSLPEQVLPIVDLMAISSSHFAKLRDFITLQLPSGFPVKIEIPLFHVLNARVTFGNIFAFDEPVASVTSIKDGNVSACVIEDDCFEAPKGYKILGSGTRQWSSEDENELLQLAIQQYLIEEGTEEDQVTLWEALRRQPDADLQRAIEESLRYSCSEQSAYCAQTIDNTNANREETIETHANGVLPNLRVNNGNNNTTNNTIASLNQYEIDDLQAVIELSRREKENEDRRRQQEDDALLEKVIQMSLVEQ